MGPTTIEIDGYDHSRSTRPGVPAIFGMNFQTVSTAKSCRPQMVKHAGAAAAAFIGVPVGDSRVPDLIGTVQVAPTILALLGVNPRLLQAVRAENTAVLPMIR